MSAASDVVVLGAGGHAKVCIELLGAMGRNVAWAIGAPGSPDTCVGVPVLIGDENIAQLFDRGYRHAFVALGNNRRRHQLGVELVASGYTLLSAVSPTAVISPSATVGGGVAIMAGVVINAEAAIGDGAIINTGATVDHDCSIGAAVHIAPQCGLAGNVVVGDYAFLGAGCTVIPEVRVGAGTIVGAGSVVVKDLPPSVTAAGVPARVIRVHNDGATT